MLKGILIGVLCYSFILLIFNIYKDNSSYDMIDWPDMVIGGPFCWVFLLICIIILKPLYKVWKKHRKPVQYKKKSEKYIKRIVAKLIKRNRDFYSRNEIAFDFNSYSSGSEYAWDGVEGWEKLMVLGRKNAKLNKQFETLMFKQKEETLPVLITYFTPITEEYMREHEWDSYIFDCVIKNKNTVYRISD